MRIVIATLLCFSLTGCLAAVVLPDVDVTPKVNVATDDVQAFRAEKRRVAGFWGTLGSTWLDNYDDSITLSPARINNKQIARHASAKTYYCIALILVGVKEKHELEVVLYRPGYEAVVVDSWPWWFPIGYALPQEVEWKEAIDLNSQRNALLEITRRYSTSRESPEISSFIEREQNRLQKLEESTTSAN